MSTFSSRTVRLVVHKSEVGSVASEVRLTPAEFADVVDGDLLEVYHPNSPVATHCLLQYSAASEVPRLNLNEPKLGQSTDSPTALQSPMPFAELLQKDTISIDHSIAAQFNLKPYTDVVVGKIAKKAVTVDLVELIFREQYVSRSDMYRMRKRLLGSCAFLKKQIEHFGMRMVVGDMYHGGVQVTCGYIDEDTRVVFRSNSTTVYIFIQMSAEMWEFDPNGDLYFEKCVNGLLPKMLRRWAEAKTSHYVSVVIFSRWYYEEEGIDQLPDEVTSRMCSDHMGRRYQDFYRLLVQNEHYEHWDHIIVQLRRAFYSYRASIDSFHRRSLPNDAALPHVRNSSAADGSFLEVLNICMNAFNLQALDRRFETCGQQIIFVTPGSGVWHVERNMTAITKQRLMDTGVSLDTVCLGEQPLHAVPLFVFHNTTQHDHPFEDYFIPHWMNSSYYVSDETPGMPRYRARIKVPQSYFDNSVPGVIYRHGPAMHESGDIYEYPDPEKYDTTAFAGVLYATSGGIDDQGHMLMTTYSTQTTPVDQLIRPRVRGGGHQSIKQSIEYTPSPTLHRPATIVEETAGATPTTTQMMAATSLDAASRQLYAVKTEKEDELRIGSVERSLMYLQQSSEGRGSATDRPKSTTKRKQLINPFRLRLAAESDVRITANRRRWIHVFPLDAHGNAMQQHHTVAGDSTKYMESTADDGPASVRQTTSAINEEEGGRNSITIGSQSPAKLLKPLSVRSRAKRTASSTSAGVGIGQQTAKQNKRLWAWGSTGEERWNPDMVIGVDWKSLTHTGQLPITNDFFPDAQSLSEDYLISEYSILLDVSNEAILWARRDMDYRLAIFDELICQRLLKGFQIVLMDKKHLHSAINAVKAVLPHVEKECVVSVGRIYHRLWLIGPVLYVTTFTPNQSLNLPSISYSYQFQVPDASSYEHNTTRFECDAFGAVNWSLLDNYVGDTYQSAALLHTIKCTTCRLMIVPSGHPMTKHIMTTEGTTVKCDGYEEELNTNADVLVDGFIRFMEVVHKLRRPPHTQRFVVEEGEERLSPQRKSPASPPTTPLTASLPSAIIAAVIAGGDNGGLFMLSDHRFSNRYTFISAELVHWLMRNVIDAGSKDAAQSFVDEGHIEAVVTGNRDLSSAGTSSFIFGFALYQFTLGNEKKKSARLAKSPGGLAGDMMAGSTDGASFLTVAFSDTYCQDSDTQCRYAPTYCDIPMPSTSGRVGEWAQLWSAGAFNEKRAFDIHLQWLVATGSAVADLVLNSWHRRAVACRLTLVPVPKDPFALPTDAMSDPLRCPIYVPFNVDTRAKYNLENVNMERLNEVRVALLTRFGFIPMACNVHPYNAATHMYETNKANCSACPVEYIHVSGGMFVRFSQSSSGLLWAWNHLLSHRWRTNKDATADERFQDRMLADFRRFCDNDDDRLEGLCAQLSVQIVQ